MGNIAKQEKSLTEILLYTDKPGIVTQEKKIDFPAIVRSKEASVMKLRQENYDQLFNYATLCAGNFLEICYPNQLPLAPVMANDLIEKNPYWKAADFINLFKFIRQRQDIKQLQVLGNQITIPKFMEMVSIYEDWRAQEDEKYRQEQKFISGTGERKAETEQMKFLIKKEMDGRE